MRKPNIAALNAQDSANYWKRKYEKLEKEFNKLCLKKQKK